MIANNFFRALADFFTDVLFIPFDKLRFTDDWWISNTFNFVLFFIGLAGFYFWMSQLKKFSKRAKL
jgi:Family of unknown function (DUF6341)